MLRILIADDHELARRGIRSVLESHPGWEVCAEASDGQEALTLALKEKLHGWYCFSSVLG